MTYLRKTHKVETGYSFTVICVETKKVLSHGVRKTRAQATATAKKHIKILKAS